MSSGLWAALLLLGLLVGLAILELWIAEGAHLGQRFVIWLYDLTASRYDRIKQFNPDWERRTLGTPLAALAPGMPWVRFLDVGAGTGRVARTLIPLPDFEGSLFNLEASRRMLELGRQLTASKGNHWLQSWAVPLPFPANVFDVVTCLEVLEFTPDPQATLRELVRVLRPGGWLVVTNRVGRQAPLILGRTFSRDRFPPVLRQAGLDDVQTYAWQVEYDLVWAKKPLDADF